MHCTILNRVQRKEPFIKCTLYFVFPCRVIVLVVGWSDMYVRHAQKIAIFFERAKHAVPFKIKNILFIKIYINLLGPKIRVAAGGFVLTFLFFSSFPFFYIYKSYYGEP